MVRVVKISQFYLHPHTFIHDWNEPYLHLHSQPKLVFIYRSQEGREAELAKDRYVADIAVKGQDR